MYPLIYHLGIDDYFPNEDFEPHRFEHVAAWRRDARRPSMVRRAGAALLRAVRLGRRAVDDGQRPASDPAPRRAGDPVGLTPARALPEGTFPMPGVADSVGPWPGPPMTMRTPRSRPRTRSVAPAHLTGNEPGLSSPRAPPAPSTASERHPTRPPPTRRRDVTA